MYILNTDKICQGRVSCLMSIIWLSFYHNQSLILFSTYVFLVNNVHVYTCNSFQCSSLISPLYKRQKDVISMNPLLLVINLRQFHMNGPNCSFLSYLETIIECLQVIIVYPNSMMQFLQIFAHIRSSLYSKHIIILTSNVNATSKYFSTS